MAANWECQDCGEIKYGGAPGVCMSCGGEEWEIHDPIPGLTAELAALDAKVAAEQAATGDVTEATALAWWDVATTLRDMRKTKSVQ